ncbi:tetratricopeptide repeat protein [Methyloversatilis sp. XJ19-49]|uniref:nuclear transport factor 2 family protein n=1 Tax=Methyloversatilis sp. XJ19-49 TaxID=2963429 RepID=UPI00211BB8E4|nr:tetratricopeptide repeat protein [Methyloversatilis sp. XJ19-49]MCQ9378674.1 tetratricopeptide repeat protein [Methyloversatilis sp. XJ19-49]
MASSTRFRLPLASRIAAALIMLGVSLQPAFANSVQEAEKLLRQKQPQQALEQIDLFLAKVPRDPQGRFFKGLILTELGRVPEATSVFQKLTEDYPELPEPYNNLAVLYAQQKQFDKAKTALEMAIRTHPSYAVAHENLGDIYARMATQAYDRALQLDSSNIGAQSKLNLIREMVGNAPRGGSKPTSSSTLAATPPSTVAAVTPPVAVVPPKPPEPAKPASPAATATATATETPAATPSAAAAASPTDGAAGLPMADITRTIEGWAAAWARKDVSAYLALYDSTFEVPGKKSRKAWEAERRARIDKPGAIEVRIENVQVTRVGADRVKATFRQHYKAVGLKSSTTKTLVLVSRDGRWMIQRERVGG